MKQTIQAKRDKAVIFVIRKTWDSLESHLELCYKKPRIAKETKQFMGSSRFHKKTVKEYASMIKKLADTL